MSGRYECQLSGETLKKAIVELNEPDDDVARHCAIDKLRRRFRDATEDSHKTRDDDSFLLRFLRVRKYNEDAALKTLLNYHTQRTKEWKELFDLVAKPILLKTLAEDGPLIPLKNVRAGDGTFVVVGRPGRAFKEKNDILKFFAIIILTLEYLLENEEFQIYGLTIIHDMSDFGLSAAFQMRLYGKRFLHTVQEVMPIRVKSLNLVNEAFVFDAVYAIMSKFMKEKVKQRLQLHGSKYDRIHDIVDASFLPSFLNGTGPDLDADWMTTEVLRCWSEEAEL